MEVDFKESHRKGLGRFFHALVLLIFIGGIGIRLSARGRAGFAWEAARDVGTFASVGVAVTFFYERFIRTEERKLYLSDLNQLLSQYLPSREDQLIVYEQGRPTLAEKLELINTAQFEVVELGIALRTFVSYFEMRPAAEFRDRVATLVARGVRFRCLILDPASRFLDKTKDREVFARIEASIQYLVNLGAQMPSFEASPGFAVFLYDRVPHFAAVCVDAESEHGQILVSPYLHGAKNAESPGFLIRKSSHPILFDKFWQSIKSLLNEARIARGQASSQDKN